MSPQLPPLDPMTIFVTDHASARPFVLVDARTWTWDPEDRDGPVQRPNAIGSTTAPRRRLVNFPPPRRKRRVQLGNGGTKTGKNTGALVLTVADVGLDRPDPEDTTGLQAIATSLIHKSVKGDLPHLLCSTDAKPGRYGELTDLLDAYGLALDLVAPSAFHTTLAHHLAEQARLAEVIEAEHEAAEAEEAARQLDVDSLTARLAALDITFSEHDITADVREAGEDLYDLSRATLLRLLTLAEAGS
jgi:hypothetical protein